VESASVEGVRNLFCFAEGGPASSSTLNTTKNRYPTSGLFCRSFSVHSSGEGEGVSVLGRLSGRTSGTSALCPFRFLDPPKKRCHFPCFLPLPLPLELCPESGKFEEGAWSTRKGVSTAKTGLLGLETFF